MLLAAFDAVIPPGIDARVPLGARDVPLDRFLDDLVEHAPLHFVAGLRGASWLLVLAPLFVLGTLRGFPSLDSAERLRILERLRESSLYLIREIPLLLKTVACLGYCGLPEVQRGLGILPIDATPPEWARGAGAEPGEDA